MTPEQIAEYEKQADSLPFGTAAVMVRELLNEVKRSLAAPLPTGEPQTVIPGAQLTIGADGREGKSPAQGTTLMAKGAWGCAALSRAAHVGLGVFMWPTAALLRRQAGGTHARSKQKDGMGQMKNTLAQGGRLTRGLSLANVLVRGPIGNSHRNFNNGIDDHLIARLDPEVPLKILGQTNSVRGCDLIHCPHTATCRGRSLTNAGND